MSLRWKSSGKVCRRRRRWAVRRAERRTFWHRTVERRPRIETPPADPRWAERRDPRTFGPHRPGATLAARQRNPVRLQPVGLHRVWPRNPRDRCRPVGSRSGSARRDRRGPERLNSRQKRDPRCSWPGARAGGAAGRSARVRVGSWQWRDRQAIERRTLAAARGCTLSEVRREGGREGAARERGPRPCRAPAVGPPSEAEAPGAGQVGRAGRGETKNAEPRRVRRAKGEAVCRSRRVSQSAPERFDDATKGPRTRRGVASGGGGEGNSRALPGRPGPHGNNGDGAGSSAVVAVGGNRGPEPSAHGLRKGRDTRAQAPPEAGSSSTSTAGPCGPGGRTRLGGRAKQRVERCGQPGNRGRVHPQGSAVQDPTGRPWIGARRGASGAVGRRGRSVGAAGQLLVTGARSTDALRPRKGGGVNATPRILHTVTARLRSDRALRAPL